MYMTSLFFPNLRAEMARHSIRTKDVAKLLNSSEGKISNMLADRTKKGFGLEEATLIRDTYFPGLQIDYLFAKTSELPTTLKGIGF